MRIILTLSSATFDRGLLWVVLYVGPDMILPLTSALAAIAGVLLMFWQRFVALVGSLRDMLFRRNKTPRA